MNYKEEPVEDVRCPLCLATTGRVLYTVTPEESAKVFIRPASDRAGYLELTSIIRGLWGTTECRQVRCEGCGSVYSWPHRAGNARFYNLAFRDHMRYPQDRWEFHAAAKFVKPETSGPMLELGAGDGAFVRILKAAGVPGSAISAVEYSDEGRRHLAMSDPALSVFSDLDDFLRSAEPNRCSHVFAFQVLEHVQEPVRHLKSFRRALQTGGLVCIAVPNAARIEANERNGLLLDMPPNHVTRFTVAGFTALAGQAGFELVHHEVEPVAFGGWFKEFVAYRFKRRVQDDSSLENWLERMLPWSVAAVGGGLLSLPAALWHSRDRKEGGSSFCVLRAV